MDKHERGWEIQEGRDDIPLPNWNGSYGGDPKRLPKVVQKLLLRRPLSPEEKAELLWRYYELDQSRQSRNRVLTGTIIVLLILGAFALIAAFPPDWARQEMVRLLGPGRS
jgi:hypothetical protein